MTEKELHRVAQQAINQGDFERAQHALIPLLNANPNMADGYFLLGIIEAELGSFTKATKLIEKACRLHACAEYFAHLAKCYAMLGNSTLTHKAIKSALDCPHEQALTLDTLGVALSRIGDHKNAIILFERAIALQKTPAFFYNLGSSQTFAAQFDAARRSYEAAIAMSPLFYQAHSSLSHLGGISPQDNHIARLLEVDKQLSHPDAKLHIAHALSREYEALGEYDKCFQVLASAKQAKRQKLSYTFSQDKQIFDAIRRLDQALEAVSNNDESQAKPVFVVGMPRSGTTLMERVLTNHAETVAIGERQEFGLAVKAQSGTQTRHVLDIETLAAIASSDYAAIGHAYIENLQKVVDTTLCFVDKMPLNILYAGLICRSLPHAKIVCMLRNPMDTVWGNYKQLFSLNDPYYRYAFDQVSTAQYYAEFKSLALYWQERYPRQFFLQSYDDFVQHPAHFAPKIFDFCGLSFSPSLLDITQNESAVATASSVQVRSAINAKSLGQWRRVSKHLSAALDTFEQLGIECS